MSKYIRKTQSKINTELDTFSIINEEYRKNDSIIDKLEEELAHITNVLDIINKAKSLEKSLLLKQKTLYKCLTSLTEIRHNKNRQEQELNNTNVTFSTALNSSSTQLLEKDRITEDFTK